MQDRLVARKSGTASPAQNLSEDARWKRRQDDSETLLVPEPEMGVLLF